mmetsp:Transcript_31813/g.47457  ORF Transcript_31813/g.47457 Transcript_31813/m.47457 type:complete len:117 (-) Transcript_31813:128-478(-)
MNRAITQVTTTFLHRLSLFRQTFFGYPQLSLAGMDALPSSSSTTNNDAKSLLDTALWFAVPKSRISKSKKRMKTTNQKRVKVKDHIVVDGRTGEVTLRHRLPHNWKDYLPDLEKKD